MNAPNSILADMSSKKITYISTCPIDRAFHDGLIVKSDKDGEYYLKKEWMFDSAFQHWNSPYKDHPHGHILKLSFTGESEECQKFADWLISTNEYEPEEEHEGISHESVGDLSPLMFAFKDQTPHCSALLTSIYVSNDKTFMLITQWLSEDDEDE